MNGSIFTVIGVSNFGFVVLRRIEVGHERGDVLCGRQPRVDVLPGVEEPTRGDGNVGHFVPVEGEGEV